MDQERQADGYTEASETHSLVTRCLDGDETAWCDLVARYKNLILAVVRRSGTERAEEADLCQAIWLDIYRALDSLRNHDSLRYWIGTLARHKCYHWGRRSRPVVQLDDSAERLLLDPGPPADEELAELLRRQQVREAILSLPPRCRELVQSLFLTDPPIPYARLAEKLGLAEGSIGSLRSSCLQRLRRVFELRHLL